MFVIKLFLFLKEFCSPYCQTKDCESRKKHIEPDSSGDFVTSETIVEVG